MNRKRAVVGLGALSLCVSCFAQSGPPEIVVVAHIDKTMQPTTPIQSVQQCLNDTVCSGVVNLITSALTSGSGGKSGSIDAGGEGIVVNPVVLPVVNKGEESWYSFQLPDGYRYCHMHIETGSKVPQNGDDSPVMTVRADGNQFSAYAWVPKGKLGQGKTWIEATYTVTGVRPDLAASYRANGKCNSSESHEIVSCRGSGPGSQHGMRPCTQFDD